MMAFLVCIVLLLALLFIITLFVWIMIKWAKKKAKGYSKTWTIRMDRGSGSTMDARDLIKDADGNGIPDIVEMGMHNGEGNRSIKWRMRSTIEGSSKTNSSFRWGGREIIEVNGKRRMRTFGDIYGPPMKDEQPERTGYEDVIDIEPENSPSAGPDEEAKILESIMVLADRLEKGEISSEEYDRRKKLVINADQ